MLDVSMQHARHKYRWTGPRPRLGLLPTQYRLRSEAPPYRSNSRGSHAPCVRLRLRAATNARAKSREEETEQYYYQSAEKDFTDLLPLATCLPARALRCELPPARRVTRACGGVTCTRGRTSVCGRRARAREAAGAGAEGVWESEARTSTQAWQGVGRAGVLDQGRRVSSVGVCLPRVWLCAR